MFCFYILLTLSPLTNYIFLLRLAAEKLKLVACHCVEVGEVSFTDLVLELVASYPPSLSRSSVITVSFIPLCFIDFIMFFLQ